MSLNNFYNLRNSFLVIGLTGRSGSGCNEICNFLKSETNPFLPTNTTIPNDLHINEIQKFKICRNILIDPSNTWRKFSVIKYRDVLLLFFFKEYQGRGKLTFESLLNLFEELYNPPSVITRRLGQKEDTDNIVSAIFHCINENKDLIKNIETLFSVLQSNMSLSDDDSEVKNKLFFDEFANFASDFFRLIDKIDPVARQLFLQDVACNLRSSGNVYFKESHVNEQTESIFTVATAIKNLIKINRKTAKPTRILIDSLKNSLEINFFRERYSGFYLIASSRDDLDADERLTYKVQEMGLLDKYDHFDIVEGLKRIDEAHYRTKDFKSGKFTTPDIENCIQKADYYIYNDSPEKPNFDDPSFRYLTLEMQLLKFLALIYKPGIVTPSAIERSMQLAFSSKYNSGCISRQLAQ